MPGLGSSSPMGGVRTRRDLNETRRLPCFPRYPELTELQLAL